MLKRGILLQVDELRRLEPTLQGLGKDEESLFKAASKSLTEKLAREAGEKALNLVKTLR